MRASGVQWQQNGPRRTRAHSRPPGARVPEPGSPALGAWPRAGHSELKTGAVSTRADEKITQFPQNPIFKTASGVWLWVRRRNCARSRPQLPSGQGHGGTPREWALHSPGGGGPGPGCRQLARALPLPSAHTGHVQRTQEKPPVLAQEQERGHLVPRRGDPCPLLSCLCALAPSGPSPGRSSRRSPGASRSGMETPRVTRGHTHPAALSSEHGVPA